MLVASGGRGRLAKEPLGLLGFAPAGANLLELEPIVVLGRSERVVSAHMPLASG